MSGFSGGGVARQLLTAARTYYVRTDGSDSNTGLVDSAGGAFLTLQKAYDVIAGTLDFAGFTVTVQIKDGTYTAGVLMNKGWTGGGALTWQGNNGTPTNVVINVTSGDDFKATGVLPGTVLIKDMQLKTTTSGNCINQSAAGLITFQNIDFGAAQTHLNCGSASGGSGANLQCTGNYTISGAATFAHVVGSRPCNIDIQSFTVTISGTPALATFALVTNGAVLAIVGITFSGSATGTRYAVSNGGQIYTNGAGTTYLPGNAAGSGTNYGTSPYGLYV